MKIVLIAAGERFPTDRMSGDPAVNAALWVDTAPPGVISLIMISFEPCQFWCKYRANQLRAERPVIVSMFLDGLRDHR